MLKDSSAKELFEFIRTIDTGSITSLKTILKSYSFEKHTVSDLMDSLKSGKNVLLIDARSEKEFQESAIFGSVNFPVLNDFERHNVGLIYKKHSQSSALWLAMQYADPKSESLKTFLEKNNAPAKNIFVYCWRGGGRSAYLSKMISDLGYKPVVLSGGQRSYRRSVNDFFSKEKFPYKLLELSGLTGCGKTEMLKVMSNDLPVIDLEDAAKHYSSLLGHIPYEINNFPPVATQSAFENNLYSQIVLNSQFDFDNVRQSAFLIESESKKVGRFDVPKNLYKKMEKSPSIRITGSMENRVKRIVRDYFGNDLRGIEPMKKKLIEKEVFFKQQLSSKVFSELIALLDSERVNEFTEIMIKDYYDKKYKDKGKKPVAEISSDDIASAKKGIMRIYKSVFSNL